MGGILKIILYTIGRLCIIGIVLSLLVLSMAHQRAEYYLSINETNQLKNNKYPNTITLFIDASFSSLEKNKVLEGIDTLMDRLECMPNIGTIHTEARAYYLLNWAADNKQFLFNATNKLNWPYYFTRFNLDRNIIGKAYIPSGDIFILDTNDLRATTIHELIHILTYSTIHSNNPRSIMYHEYRPNQELIQEELDSICKTAQ